MPSIVALHNISNTFDFSFEKWKLNLLGLPQITTPAELTESYPCWLVSTCDCCSYLSLFFIFALNYSPWNIFNFIMFSDWCTCSSGTGDLASVDPCVVLKTQHIEVLWAALLYIWQMLLIGVQQKMTHLCSKGCNYDLSLQSSFSCHFYMILLFCFPFYILLLCKYIFFIIPTLPLTVYRL